MAMHVLVRGHTDPALASVGRIKRELCIDESRKTVVWETWESKYGKQLFTYSKTDRGAAATGGVFEFKPPSGSALTEFSLPVPRPLGVMSAATARGVTPPKLVHKTEPAYGKESRRKRIEGTVVLWAPIGKDGVPVEIAIYRSLTRDLDAEAMKAVRKWRFTPAMKDGQPIATRVTIDVNFRLLRPAKK